MGWNDFVKGDFDEGTNGLNAFEACVECGACSEQKFLESDEYKSFNTGAIIGTIIGIAIPVIIGISFLCWCCKGM